MQARDQVTDLWWTDSFIDMLFHKIAKVEVLALSHVLSGPIVFVGSGE